jgi:hypothetical protein
MARSGAPSSNPAYCPGPGVFRPKLPSASHCGLTIT